MSKFTVIGDPHCKPENLDKIKRLFTIVESEGLPAIWMGDLLDTKDIVRAQCLNAYLTYFKSSKLEHIILTGNHDYTTADCKEHALEALKGLKNVTVVDKPHFEGKSLFLPYFSNTEAFRASIHPYDLAQFLFMHQGINGCDYGNGFVAENELDIQVLSKFDRVISGHFHRYQIKDNLTYIGTPFSHSFGESNQIKYLGIFDDSNGSLELIETDFPKHITEEYHIFLGDENHLKLDSNNYNRVLLIGSREEIANFDKSKFPGVKFIDSPTLLPSQVTIKETQTPEAMFTNWFKHVKKETNDDLYQTGLRILKDVN